MVTNVQKNGQDRVHKWSYLQAKQAWSSGPPMDDIFNEDSQDQRQYANGLSSLEVSFTTPERTGCQTNQGSKMNAGEKSTETHSLYYPLEVGYAVQTGWTHQHPPSCL